MKPRRKPDFEAERLRLKADHIDDVQYFPKSRIEQRSANGKAVKGGMYKSSSGSYKGQLQTHDYVTNALYHDVNNTDHKLVRILKMAIKKV